MAMLLFRKPELNDPFVVPSVPVEVKREYPLIVGCAGLWLFEKSGARDYSDIGSNGTFVNSPSIMPSGNGPVPTFNGTTQAVNFATRLFSTYAAAVGTFACWASCTAYGQIICYESANGRNQFVLSFPGSSTSVISVNIGSNVNILGNKTGYLLNTVYHFAITWNGTTVGIYVNGQPDAILTNSSVPNAPFDAAGTQFGRYLFGSGGNGAYLPGSIFLPYLNKRALSAAEIGLLYAKPFGMFRPIIRRQFYFRRRNTGNFLMFG